MDSETASLGKYLIPLGLTEGSRNLPLRIDKAEEEPTNNALMAFTSSSYSSFDNEVVSCLKACTKAYATLQSHYDKLTYDFRKSQFYVISYKTGLESVEARVLVYQQNKTVFEEDIKLLKLEFHLRDNALVVLRQKIEKAEQEMDNLKLKYHSEDGCHVVPPPYTGTFMPPKPDLVFHNAPNNAPSFVQPIEQVKTPRPSVKTIETSISTAKPKTAIPKPKSNGNRRNRKACFVCKHLDHLIKDCDFYEKKMAQTSVRNHAQRGNHQQYARMTLPNPQKHVIPIAVLTKSKLVPISVARPVTVAVPKPLVTRLRQVKTVVTKPHSPPRRNLNRNPSPKASTFPLKVTAAQTPMVNDVKGNWMCDKKNIVLFTDTECLVLSPEFKLPDESQVLLRVHRENNLYNIDLKNIVPSRDLTCLFAKATLDESNLWHRRLCHINFKTMNKLRRTKLKVSKLKRLKRVGTAQRVDTYDDTVMDDVSKQGRIIVDMDADVDVTLKDVADIAKEVAADAEIEESAYVQGRQAESQAQIYQIDLEHADKVMRMQDDEVEPAELQEVVEVVTTTKLITEVVTTASATITAASLQLTTAAAPTLTTAPSAARRRKKSIKELKPLKKQAQIEQDEAFARELEAELNKTINWDAVIDQVQRKEKEDNAVMRYQALKRKPQTEAQARKNMMIYQRNMAGFKMGYFKGMTYNDIRPIFEKKFNSNVALLQKTKEQMEKEDIGALKRTMPNDDDDVYTEATPLARKVPIVDYEIYTENNKPYYKIIRADESLQLFLSFLSLLRNFDRKDLEVLWELVKERFTTFKPKNFSDDFLLTTLTYMFEKPDVQAQVRKNQRTVHGLAKVKRWRLLESCGVHIIKLTSTQMILLVERRYPLTRFTLDQMLNNVRLEVEEESEDCARSALLERVKDNMEDAGSSDLMKIAMTSLSSKILSQDKEHFATLAVDAVMRLKGSMNLESIQIIKKAGGSLKYSFLDEGEARTWSQSRSSRKPEGH
nr:T-complex protein 1 subunit beta [Tanacetum cinerariifolium]